MNTGAKPKILELGSGEHEKSMLEKVIDVGYDGPIGILDHQKDLDSEEVLKANLEGLASIVDETKSEASPGVTGYWELEASPVVTDWPDDFDGASFVP